MLVEPGFWTKHWSESCGCEWLTGGGQVEESPGQRQAGRNSERVAQSDRAWDDKEHARELRVHPRRNSGSYGGSIHIGCLDADRLGAKLGWKGGSGREEVEALFFSSNLRPLQYAELQKANLGPVLGRGPHKSLLPPHQLKTFPEGLEGAHLEPVLGKYLVPIFQSQGIE